MKQVFQIVSWIESFILSRVISLKFAMDFLHITYPNMKIQECSIVAHENDSSTKQNY